MPEFFTACLSPSRRSITPNGQAGTQYPQPLQTSSCTTTVPNSVRNSAPVGHTSRHAASVQCLHTSDDINQRMWPEPTAPELAPLALAPLAPTPSCSPPVTCNASRFGCSMNATCRHVSAPRPCVLSYDIPVKTRPSSGT